MYEVYTKKKKRKFSNVAGSEIPTVELFFFYYVSLHAPDRSIKFPAVFVVDFVRDSHWG